MTNVLGLPLEEALALLTGEDVRVVELKGKLPRVSNENQDSTAPRENEPRGTLRVVRQREGELCVCRFNDMTDYGEK